MNLEINENMPAFILNINNKEYILKLGLMGTYEIFSYPYDPKDELKAEVFFSYEKYKKRLNHNK